MASSIDLACCFFEFVFKVVFFVFYGFIGLLVDPAEFFYVKRSQAQVINRSDVHHIYKLRF